MATFNVILQRVQPEDWPRLARLEVDAFGDDGFSSVAFGPRRFDEDVLQERAREMGEDNSKPGEISRNVKAVLDNGDGTNQIVGYARWQTVLVDEGGVGIYAYLQEDQNVEGNATKEKEEKKVKTVANAKLCDDLFIPGDRHMATACDGKDYHKLYTLIVDPKFQRRGIGAMLLASGLNDADTKNLQCTLGASPEGLGLYKKYGFNVVAEMSLNLWEYEGGQGKGVVDHCIMHRPAKVKP